MFPTQDSIRSLNDAIKHYSRTHVVDGVNVIPAFPNSREIKALLKGAMPFSDEELSWFSKYMPIGSALDR